jgi:hypothetical protein
MKRWEAPALLRPLERDNLNQWMDLTEQVSLTFSPEDGNTPGFRNIVLFRIPDDGQNPTAQ